MVQTSLKFIVFHVHHIPTSQCVTYEEKGTGKLIEKRTYVHYLFLWGWAPGPYLFHAVFGENLAK